VILYLSDILYYLTFVLLGIGRVFLPAVVVFPCYFCDDRLTTHFLNTCFLVNLDMHIKYNLII